MAVVVRQARAEDHGAYARLHAELGVPDAPMSPELWATSLDRCIVLEDGDQIVGYGLWFLYAPVLHVGNVVVDPLWRGKQLGEVIMRAVAERARASGCTEWFLNVKENNAAAIRLYERLGLRAIARSHAMDVSWDNVAALPEHHAKIRPLEPHEEAEVEARFQILPGLLAARRASPLRYSIRAPLDAEGKPAGVAASSLVRPGAHPFRVADPLLARPLLESIRPDVPANQSSFTLVIEDNEALAIQFTAAGAKTHFVITQMRAPLPAL